MVAGAPARNVTPTIKLSTIKTALKSMRKKFVQTLTTKQTGKDTKFQRTSTRSY
jgi:hypothetical protein